MRKREGQIHTSMQEKIFFNVKEEREAKIVQIIPE